MLYNYFSSIESKQKEDYFLHLCISGGCKNSRIAYLYIQMQKCFSLQFVPYV